MLILQIFEQMPDPRTPGHAVRHLLIDVLCIALLFSCSKYQGTL